MKKPACFAVYIRLYFSAYTKNFLKTSVIVSVITEQREGEQCTEKFTLVGTD